jgi:hypothetical protein
MTIIDIMEQTRPDVPHTVDSEWAIHQKFITSLRTFLREHQQHLIANPDPTDDWWFLVDPSA